MRADIRLTLKQLILSCSVKNGTYTIKTADWTAASGDQRIMPLGLGGGKLVFLGGKLPLNLQSQIYYNVVKPDVRPEWQWRFQVQILLPKSIFSKSE